jgi:hypothetical protein
LSFALAMFFFSLLNISALVLISFDFNFILIYYSY